MKKQNSRMRMAALLASTAVVAAACGADTVTDVAADVTDDAIEVVEGEEEAMEDEEEAMEDEEEAMEDEEEAMEDEEEAMEDEEEPTEELALADGEESLGGAPVNLEFNGLEPLGGNFVYEGWIIVDEAPVSTGRFTIDEIDGERTYTAESTATQSDLDNATDFVLSIEPAENDDPAPAEAKPLGGAIVDGVAELSIAHPAALGDDFSSAAGQFVITAPTTADESDDTSGVWFLEITDDGPVAGLDLPELPAGWVYEGWVVIDGQPVSTGRFLTPEGADDTAEFSGSDADAPPFPGEDFVLNAPEGLDFPTDLGGDTIVLSIEPEADDSPAPFAFKPLAAEIPEGVTPGYAGQLGAGPGFPTGTATIG